MFRSGLCALVLTTAALAMGQESAPSQTYTAFLVQEPSGPSPERYDELVVDKKQFLKSSVDIGEIATFPTYTEELLRVKWREGDPIDVSIVRPTGIAKPPVVIFMYGYGTNPEKFLDQSFCSLLASKGFAAVGFQSALTGPRYHDRPLKKWFVSELQESIGESVHDVQLMIDYLETRGDLDTRRIGIFGQGSGGAISILAASVDPRIKAVDVMNPWGDWPDWFAHSPVVPDEERAEYLSSSFLSKVSALDPVEKMNSLADRSFRLQETLYDDAVPKEVRKKMQDALPRNGELKRYPDQASYWEQVAQNGRMLAWMQDRLGISRVENTEPFPNAK